MLYSINVSAQLVIWPFWSFFHQLSSCHAVLSTQLADAMMFPITQFKERDLKGIEVKLTFTFIRRSMLVRCISLSTQTVTTCSHQICLGALGRYLNQMLRNTGMSKLSLPFRNYKNHVTVTLCLLGFVDQHCAVGAQEGLRKAVPAIEILLSLLLVIVFQRRAKIWSNYILMLKYYLKVLICFNWHFNVF